MLIEARQLKAALDVRRAGRMASIPAHPASLTHLGDNFENEAAWSIRVAEAFVRA